MEKPTEPSIREILKDYSQKDWEAWKAEGLGRVFFRFLRDSREAKRRECCAFFDSGTVIEINLPVLQSRQMAAQLAQELSELGIDDIRNFYEETK